MVYNTQITSATVNYPIIAKFSCTYVSSFNDFCDSNDVSVKNQKNKKTTKPKNFVLYTYQIERQACWVYYLKLW